MTLTKRRGAGRILPPRPSLFKIFLLATCLGIFVPSSLAENPGPSSSDDPLFHEVQRLQELKARDPELYRQIVGEKKARLQKGLQTFREKRPERYQAFLRREKEFKKRKLDYFREHHPQAFERFRNQRLEQMEGLAQRNPERFHQFLERHPRFQERHGQRLQASRPSFQRPGGREEPHRAFGRPHSGAPRRGSNRRREF